MHVALTIETLNKNHYIKNPNKLSAHEINIAQIIARHIFEHKADISFLDECFYDEGFIFSLAMVRLIDIRIVDGHVEMLDSANLDQIVSELVEKREADGKQ